MVSSQFHYTKQNRFMPFLLAEILNFQGSTHRIGVGSFSNLLMIVTFAECIFVTEKIRGAVTARIWIAVYCRSLAYRYFENDNWLLGMKRSVLEMERTASHTEERTNGENIKH